MTAAADRTSFVTLLWRAVLTLANVAAAGAVFVLAFLVFSDGVAGEFRILVPVLAVFLVLTVIDWLHGLVTTWLSRSDQQP